MDKLEHLGMLTQHVTDLMKFDKDLHELIKIFDEKGDMEKSLKYSKQRIKNLILIIKWQKELFKKHLEVIKC